jgi:cbb3-type cytochrome oxidase maturation protein
MEDTTYALILTLFVSILLGLIGLIAFLWGLRSGQFDDEERFTHGALFDSQEDLNDARDREERLKSALAVGKDKNENAKAKTLKTDKR